jgi:hypothetical protein
MMQRGSPPSDYAVLALVQGQPKALSRVAVLTAKRSLLIAPGLWLVGFRGRDLVRATAAATLSITIGLTIYYARKERENPLG